MSQWLERVGEWIEAVCRESARSEKHELICGPPLPDEWGCQGHMATNLASAHVFLAEKTGNREHLKRAREYLLLPVPTHTFISSGLWKTMNALREEQLLSADDERHIAENVLDIAEKGSRKHHYNRIGMRKSNHAVTAAALCDAFARLWPDHPKASQLLSLSEEVWADWWLMSDNMEIASNYEAFTQIELLAWAERRGELRGALDDSGTQRWIQRALDNLMPSGCMPGYGDTCTMEIWNDWMALFALVAKHTHDGRAVLAAERIFVWAENARWLDNIAIADDLNDDMYRARQAWGRVCRALSYLVLTVEVLESLPESVCGEPSEARPKITHRMLPAHNSFRDESWSLQPMENGTVIPDKAVMKLGTEADAPSAMISCSRQYWHDHIDSGAVLNFTANDTVLLDNPGYMQRYPVFHNLFWVSDESEAWLHYDTDRNKYDPVLCDDYTVKGMTGGYVAQVVELQNPAPHSLPVRHERTVMTTRRGIMVVRDQVIPYRDGLVGSPLWHVETVHEQDGNYIVGSIDEFRGMDGTKMRNGGEKLFIATPYEQGDWLVREMENEDPYASPAYVDPVTRYFTFWKRSFVTRMCISRPVAMHAGERHETLTVLMPASSASSTNAAIVQETTSPSAKVFSTADSLFVMNESTEPVSGDWGSTDARFVCFDGDGIMAHRMRFLQLDGVSISVPEGASFVDVDLRRENGRITGAVSSQSATEITVRWAGKETVVSVRGITDIDRESA